VVSHSSRKTSEMWGPSFVVNKVGIRGSREICVQLSLPGKNFSFS
jgi:hypothetical protein